VVGLFQETAVDEDENCCCGEWFGDAGDAKGLIKSARAARFKIGEPVHEGVMTSAGNVNADGYAGQIVLPDDSFDFVVQTFGCVLRKEGVGTGGSRSSGAKKSEGGQAGTYFEVQGHWCSPFGLAIRKGPGGF
jgi:hypothetical protein